MTLYQRVVEQVSARLEDMGFVVVGEDTDGAVVVVFHDREREPRYGAVALSGLELLMNQEPAALDAIVTERIKAAVEPFLASVQVMA